MSQTLPSPVDLPPAEAIRFFRQKVNLPTRRWDDLWQGANARGFAVAGVQAQDMLGDVRAAMDKALAQGTTYEEFKKDIRGVITGMGWDKRGPGYVAWRTRIIFETNLRTAYAAGRHAQMTEPSVLASRPYWRYRHSGAKEPRPEHKAWDNVVLRHDDPWWKTHDPPNGWGCACFKQAINERQLARMGKSGPDDAPKSATRTWVDPVSGEKIAVPRGIDPGWGYSVGESWTSGAVPRELAEPLRRAAEAAARQVPAALPPLPTPRPPPEGVTRLAADVTPEAGAEAFLQTFGASLDRAAVVRDATGARLVVSRDMFGVPGVPLKSGKRQRARDLPLIAEALRDPDEIWLDWVVGRRSGELLLRRRYLRRLTSPNQALVVFEWTSKGWHGVTAFPPASERYLEDERRGVLLYRRQG